MTRTKIGMREVARLAGVSPITVSRALSRPELVSEALRARVAAAVAEAGFIPDRVAGSMRSAGRIIGTVVPPLINSGIAEQVQGMGDACTERGYQLLLAQGEFSAEAEDKAITALLGWRPVGLVVQAFVQSETARARIRQIALPLVEISEIDGGTPIDTAVGVSNRQAAYTMTMHLARRGYRRIGFVSTPIHGNDRLRQRRVGYRQAMAELGAADPAALEVEVPITPQGGADALDVLVQRDPDLDVIFCSSDTLAIGAVQACHRRGWAIPGRMAVAGYGDMDLAAQIHPALTTVRVPRYAMGRLAVETLLTRLDGAPPGTVQDVGFQIIDRESA